MRTRRSKMNTLKNIQIPTFIPKIKCVKHFKAANGYRYLGKIDCIYDVQQPICRGDIYVANSCFVIGNRLVGPNMILIFKSTKVWVFFGEKNAPTKPVCKIKWPFICGKERKI